MPGQKKVVHRLSDLFRKRKNAAGSTFKLITSGLL